MRNSLPPQLKFIINDETVDFISFPLRMVALESIIGYFFLGFIFAGLGMFVVNLETDLLTFLRGDYYSENVTIITLISDARLPVLLLGTLFSVVGIFVVLRTIQLIFKDGGCFVGTPTRLVHYQNGEVKIYVWELFTNRIKVNQQREIIQFTLRTGKYERQNKSEVFVPTTIKIVSVENVAKIEKVARERISSLSHLVKSSENKNP